MTNTLSDYQQELARKGETIRLLQEELAETNQGLVALSMELEQRVDQRTAELQDAQAELKRTNSELLILTMELEDRVTQRTEELSRTLAALREAEDRTAFALGVTHIGTLDLGLADGALRTSAVFDRILGYDTATADWTYDRFLGHVLPEDRERVEQSYQEMLKRQADWNVECRVHSRDALIRWIRIHGRIRVDEQTQSIHLVGIIQDISSRKQDESRIRKLSQIYATLSRTNETIVRATDVDQLYTRLIDAATSQGQFALAWIGLVDPATQWLEPYPAAAGVSDLEAFRMHLAATESRDDPTAIAIRENRVVTLNDLKSRRVQSAATGTALRRGLQGAAALPFRTGERVLGAMTLYTAGPAFFDDDQVRLLNEMSSDISFALQKFEEENQRRRAETERETALDRLKNTLEGSIEALARTIETRDPYTAGHQQRVSQLAVAIAGAVGLDSSRMEGLGFGALIHDIGKIAVPSEILTTPRRLTALEMELIRTHAQSGYDIMKDIDFPWPVAQMILQHHERLDGSGYPRGLRGDEILPEARILAVADVVEAMSSHRPYRPGFGIDKALEHIQECRGTLYDPQAVDACTDLFRHRNFTFASNF